MKKTRPYRPQTNGEIERFHRVLIGEWAYIRAWPSEAERHNAHVGFIRYYNHHRSHGALKWATPIATLKHLIEDNVPAEHTEHSISGSTGRHDHRSRRDCRTSMSKEVEEPRWL